MMMITNSITTSIVESIFTVNNSNVIQGIIATTLPALPIGFKYLIDNDGNYLIDDNNNYMFGEI